MLANRRLVASSLTLFALAACGVESDGRDPLRTAESCMVCHNGSQHDDYAGPGMENPHPFGAANVLRCTTCHGGNGNGSGKDDSHVPPPPEIGDRDNQRFNNTSYFNRLTLAGVDKLPDYTANGTAYTALDYLQFVNPSDLRVVTVGRACGQCHQQHSAQVANGPLATETGILSSATYATGAQNRVPANRGLFEDTAADLSFRAASDTGFTFDPSKIGEIGSLVEHPVYSVFGEQGTGKIYRNPDYDADELDDDVDSDNSVITESPLADLFHEQVAFTCGDCHLGSSGANNRYGDFRPSGCAACHMRASLDGRSHSRDPNVDRTEPLDPDNIEQPELPHLLAHRIRSVKKTLSSGETIEGIDDYACAGCHQGSNRTVMQYWGIRLDQNQDLRRKVQYPANPVSFRNTARDQRLFDPEVRNRTFNGRNANQYILFEDYDGDGRDDTPQDVHYAAGMGCIDCHGSYDLHGGDVDVGERRIVSRMEQAVAITCESCHGTATAYAQTVTGTAWNGNTADLAVDSKGNPLRHVVRDSSGDYYLYSKLTGAAHYIPQTMDTLVDTGRTNPVTGDALYSPKASYAMGRDDGSASSGTGPHQTGTAAAGFSHMDNMDCASCHSSWTNTCTGCHLVGEYDTRPNNFSNITGQRIVFRQKIADFVYQSPVPFQLGVNTHDKITQIAPNTLTFFQWEDRHNDTSRVFAFTDRNGGGNNPSSPYASLSHNAMLAHSIRGKVTSTNEGPRYCVACHLTQSGLAKYGTEYDAFRTAMATNDFGALDFDLLQTHIGRNTGNQLDSPIWVHMVAGLGSGLYLFDQNGCPVNPLDTDTNRAGCNNVAPKTSFDISRAAFNLDRIVDPSGLSTGSQSHALLNGGTSTLRAGASNDRLAGPLGAALVQRLTDPTTGIVLDSWLDANGDLKGDASTWVK